MLAVFSPYFLLIPNPSHKRHGPACSCLIDYFINVLLDHWHNKETKVLHSMICGIIIHNFFTSCDYLLHLFMTGFVNFVLCNNIHVFPVYCLIISLRWLAMLPYGRASSHFISFLKIFCWLSQACNMVYGRHHEIDEKYDPKLIFDILEVSKFHVPIILIFYFTCGYMGS